MAPTPIDRVGMLLALNSALEEIDWYVDLHTGDVVPHSRLGLVETGGGPDPTLDAARYQAIEPLHESEARAMRAAFTATVADPGLRARLEEALAGEAAFRAFHDALADDPEEEARWRAYEEERLLQAARTQLEQDGVEAEFVSRA